MPDREIQLRRLALLAAASVFAAAPAYAQSSQFGGSSSGGFGGSSGGGLGGSSLGSSSLGGSSMGGSSLGGSTLGGTGGLSLFGSPDSSPFARSSGSGCQPGEVALSTGCLNLDVDPATGRSAGSGSPFGSTGGFK